MFPRNSGAWADHQEGSLAAPNMPTAAVERPSSKGQQGRAQWCGQKPASSSLSTPHTQLQSCRWLLQPGSADAGSVDVDAAATLQSMSQHSRGDTTNSFSSVGIQPPDNSDVESAVMVQCWLRQWGQNAADPFTVAAFQKLEAAARQREAACSEQAAA